MEAMFQRADAFKNDLYLWDTSSVTSMLSLFCYAISFNSPISSWDTSRVIKMDQMFLGASSFNRPLSSWDTSRVTTMLMILYESTNFHQTLCWNTTSTGGPNEINQMFDGSNGAFSTTPFPDCLSAKPTTTTITNANIQKAAYLWVTNTSEALAVYGDIDFFFETNIFILNGQVHT